MAIVKSRFWDIDRYVSRNDRVIPGHVRDNDSTSLDSGTSRERPERVAARPAQPSVPEKDRHMNGVEIIGYKN
jgi:hypothetical protein